MKTAGEEGSITAQKAKAGRDAGATSNATELHVRSRGYLPHWERDRGTYFVTFRLADSLPQSALDKLRAEREVLIQMLTRPRMESTKDGGATTCSAIASANANWVKRRVAELLSDRVETYLDSGYGACHLAKPQIAQMVARAIRQFEGDRYHLWAWCVMPNHVHTVAELRPGQSLAKVLHSWKSYTARRAQVCFGVQGSLWQREYYDHLVRDEDDLYRVVQYVADNPVRAGLKNWPWVWVRKAEACCEATRQD